MTSSKQKNVGVGAKCSVLLQVLHSRRDVIAKYPNAIKNQRLDNLIAIEQKIIVVNKSSQICVVFGHNDFPNQTLHCVHRYVNIVEEGDSSHFFPKVSSKRKTSSSSSSKASSNANKSSQLIPANMPPHLVGNDHPSMLDDNMRDVGRMDSNELAETICQVRDMGMNVDDDNDPLPENHPQEGNYNPTDDDDDDALHQLGQTWGCSGIDERAKVCVDNSNPKLHHGMDSIVFENITFLQMFLLFPLSSSKCGD